MSRARLAGSHLAGACLVTVLLAACQQPAGTEAPVPVTDAPAEPAAQSIAAPPDAQVPDRQMDAATPPSPALPLPGPGMAVETHWQCGDQRVAARLDPGSQTLNLIHERGQLALPRIEAASGTRYADANGNEFWDKTGDTATLTLSGTPARECGRIANGQG